MNKPLRWLLLFLAVCPALLTFWGILSCGVDVPYMDQWVPDIAGLFVRMHQGQLSVGDFFAMHNEHRIVIPRIIFFLLGLLTHWNVVAEMVVEWLAVCATSAGILWLSVKTSGGTLDRAGILKWFVANLFLFGLAQWENWLCGMGLANVLPITFIVGAIVAASSSLGDWSRTILAIALATAATFSGGIGVMAWPIVGVLMLWPLSREALAAKKFHLVVLAAALLVNVGLYLIHFSSPPRPTLADGSAQAVGLDGILQYLLIFLGNSFCYTIPIGQIDQKVLQKVLAAYAGVTMLLTLLLAIGHFIHLWIKRTDQETAGRMLIWISVATIAIGGALIAAIFRAQLGVEQARSSRYVTFSIYLPIALIYLIPLIGVDLLRRACWAKFWPPIPIVLAVIVVMLQLIRVPVDMRGFTQLRRSRLLAKGDLLLINLPPSPLRLRRDLCLDPADVRRQAPVLSEMGYLRPGIITSNDASKISVAASVQCGDVDVVKQTGPNEILLGGWAMLPDQKTPAHAVFLTRDDTAGRPIIFGIGEVGIDRTDLVNAQHRDELRLSGWISIFSMSELPPDPKQSIVRAWSLDVENGRAYRMEGEQTINVAR